MTKRSKKSRLHKSDQLTAHALSILKGTVSFRPLPISPLSTNRTRYIEDTARISSPWANQIDPLQGIPESDKQEFINRITSKAGQYAHDPINLLTALNNLYKACFKPGIPIDFQFKIEEWFYKNQIELPGMIPIQIFPENWLRESKIHELPIYAVSAILHLVVIPFTQQLQNSFTEVSFNTSSFRNAFKEYAFLMETLNNQSNEQIKAPTSITQYSTALFNTLARCIFLNQTKFNSLTSSGKEIIEYNTKKMYLAPVFFSKISESVLMMNHSLPQEKKLTQEAINTIQAKLLNLSQTSQITPVNINLVWTNPTFVILPK